MTIFLFYKAIDYIPLWSMMIAEEHLDNRVLGPLELKIKNNFQETLWRVDNFNQMIHIIKSIKCKYVTNNIDRIVLKVDIKID